MKQINPREGKVKDPSVALRMTYGCHSERSEEAFDRIKGAPHKNIREMPLFM